ncbi:olfactory receptor 4S1-like [Spea bombifrons]|uniref:olfactory receptor 4S1-like n=1 Tax=Spea bombifrons TaxID=233779 RepID=UPI0023494A5F|nr:olfactory receptor 4S1-like [Spea bombifrons]
MGNYSGVSEFHLVGFPGASEKLYLLISLTMFLIYTVVLFSNGTVILLIILKEHLHQPMYIFIANLAFSDLLFDTITLPKIIAKYWFGAETISFSSCLFQMFCVHFLGSFDSFIIMLMAVDRYIAICIPLRYPLIITHKATAILCWTFWILAASASLFNNILFIPLPFCGPNKIKSCFCSVSSLFPLACQDVTSVRQKILVNAMIVLLAPLGFILLSYVFILWSVKTSVHSENWQKAFYTCTTHLIIIGMYFVPRVFVYFANYVRLILNADINVLLLCLYSYLPHLANPVIYCLRTEEIKRTLAKAFKIKIKVNVK